MVRSSSTKASKEKTTASKQKAAAVSAKTPVKTKSQPGVKAAEKSKSTPTAKATTKKSSAAIPAAKTATKAKATGAVASRGTKAAPVTAGKQAKSAERKPAATSPTATKSSGAKANANRKNTQSLKKKTAELTPAAQELFDDEIEASDSPEVSVLPALADEPVDPARIDQQAKIPPEFMDNQIPRHADALPAGAKAPETSHHLTDDELEKVTFSYLGFSDELLAAVKKQNYKKPTRVQALCLPHTLDGKDVAGFAQTGTGKTAVYLLTAAQKLLKIEERKAASHKPFILVLVPTRELADQVAQDAKKLFSGLNIKSLAVFGGVDVERHANELNQAVDLVVATPGRLLDLHRSKKLELDNIQLLVIDECDRMFDMGFIDDVEYVLRHLPPERVQKLLFSATGSEKVKELAFEYLEQPEYIETDPVQITPEKISQVAFAVTAEQKFLTLMGHIKEHNPECGIIFTNTKVVAEWIGYKLACNGLDVEVLTGDIPQRKRMSLIKKIKDGQCNLLVATDVLSRGLHVANLSHVYNFDIPDDSESFIHRIGRTARAGATGHAISFICEDYGYNMGGVEKLLGFKIPLMAVPETYLTAEDKSDYPFDSTGRVKAYGQQEQASAEQPTASKRPEKSGDAADARPIPQHDRKRSNERPEPTLPHARRDEQRTVQESTVPQKHRHSVDDQKPVARPSPAPIGMPVSQQQQRSGDTAGPVPLQQQRSSDTSGHMPQQHKPHTAPTRQHTTRTQEVRGPVSHAQTQAQQRPQPASGASQHQSKDDRAKETIEMAIQAAKKAAARRQQGKSGASSSGVNNKRGVPRVTEHIDEFASAVLTGAQEKIGGAFGHLQEKFVSRFEESFPKLSETLTRLGFFSKRFTDER